MHVQMNSVQLDQEFKPDTPVDLSLNRGFYQNFHSCVLQHCGKTDDSSADEAGVLLELLNC